MQIDYTNYAQQGHRCTCDNNMSLLKRPDLVNSSELLRMTTPFQGHVSLLERQITGLTEPPTRTKALKFT